MSRRRIRAIGAALLAALLVSCGASARAEAAPQAQLLAFDIPAQDVDGALKAYAAVTGLQILYASTAIAGRRSAPVHGLLTPEVALSALLAGSGLVGRRTDVDAVAVILAPQERAPSLPVAVDSRFLGALQAAVMRGLCRDERTRPGSYRIAFQIWIAEDGAVRKAALLGSSGDQGRDAAVVRTLESLAVEAVPGGAAGRPLTMTIAPSPGRTPPCGG